MKFWGYFVLGFFEVILFVSSVSPYCMPLSHVCKQLLVLYHKAIKSQNKIQSLSLLFLHFYLASHCVETKPCVTRPQHTHISNWPVLSSRNPIGLNTWFSTFLSRKGFKQFIPLASSEPPLPHPSSASMELGSSQRESCSPDQHTDSNAPSQQRLLPLKGSTDERTLE